MFVTKYPTDLDAELVHIIKSIHLGGGKAYIVGGFVRDLVLEKTFSPSYGYDIEVYHLYPEQLQIILVAFGQVNEVGKSFGVFKLTTALRTYDVSLPRKDNKVSSGHRGFSVDISNSLSISEACKRRDFTMNSMLYDIETQEIIDPFHGLKDIHDKMIRHVSESFSEDPLRVLRAMQFAARFEFSIHPSTISLCRAIDLNELPKERLFEEFKKLFLLASKPSIGIIAGMELGVLAYFPEILSLQGVEQDPEWHPEGDVFTHTLMVIDEAAKLRSGKEFSDLCLMYGSLCHDFGKPLTTQYINGKIRSHAHDVAGIQPTKSFLARLTKDKDLIDTISTLVKEHLQPALLYKARHEVSDGAIRRLSLRVEIPLLLKVAQADHFGRFTSLRKKPESFEAGEWLFLRWKQLQSPDSRMKPLLKGSHLMKLGLSPGPIMGKIIQKSFEQQLDGKISNEEEAIRWASDYLKSSIQ